MPTYKAYTLIGGTGATADFSSSPYSGYSPQLPLTQEFSKVGVATGNTDYNLFLMQQVDYFNYSVRGLWAYYSWYVMGPDEDLGYIICTALSGTSANSQTTQVYYNSPSFFPYQGNQWRPTLCFTRSNGFSASAFISSAEEVSRAMGSGQTFPSGLSASTWLTNAGIYNNYTGAT